MEQSIYEMMLPILRNISRRYPEHLREDLVQEGLQACLRPLPPDVVVPKAWYITVATNAMIDYIRKQGTSISDMVYDMDTGEDFPYPQCSFDELAQFCATFDNREIAIIRGRLEGKTDTEIGQSLGISQQSVNTIRKQIGDRFLAWLG